MTIVILARRAGHLSSGQRTEQDSAVCRKPWTPDETPTCYCQSLSYENFSQSLPIKCFSCILMRPYTLVMPQEGSASIVPGIADATSNQVEPDD